MIKQKIVKYLMLITIAVLTFNLQFAQDKFSESQKIMIPEHSNYSYFGSSVAVSENYLVAGASRADGDLGAAYIFELKEGKWKQVVKLVADERVPDSKFGCSVAISGDRVVVGANAANTTGCAYVFEKAGDKWTQKALLKADNGKANDKFGGNVSISGDYIIISAHDTDLKGISNAGVAYIFEKEENDWQQKVKLETENINKNSNFGWAVSISGNWAAVGGARVSAAGKEFAGAVSLYERENGKWVLRKTLISENPVEEGQFGHSVSISDDKLIVGAWYETVDGKTNAGAAYIYEKENSDWILKARLTAADTKTFGEAVKISGDYALIGSDDNDRKYIGNAYLFKKENGKWMQLQKIYDSKGNKHDYTAKSVALKENFAILGAVGADNGKVKNCGAVYIFKK
ncbi:MAG: hypothetical protein ACEPO8_15715 [Rhodothermaceae bacterium]